MIGSQRFSRWWPWLWAGLITIVVIAGLRVAGERLIDLQVFSLAADALVQGEPLYTDTWNPGRFLYSPFAALAYLPVAVFPWPLEQVLWVFLCALGLIWFWRISLRPSHVPALWLAALAAVSLLLDPIRHNFRFGNVSLLLALMVLADLAGRGDRRWRGVLTGVAIGIKLTPAVFLPFLIITRQWRTLGNACGAFAATVAVGFVVRPRESLTFWTETVFDDSRYPYLASALNQSINGLILRLTDGDGSAAVWLLVCGLLGAACLVAGRMWWLRGERVLAVSVVALIALFAAPLTWLHHWAWFIPLGVGLYRASLRASVGRPVAVVVTACWFLAYARGPHRWAPDYDWLSDYKPEMHWTTWQMIIGHAYIWAAVLAVAYLIFLARRVPPGEPRDEFPARHQSSPGHLKEEGAPVVRLDGGLHHFGRRLRVPGRLGRATGHGGA